MKRILAVTSWQPFPPDNGARNRAYHLLRALCQAHELDLLAFVRDDGERAGANTIARYGEDFPNLVGAQTIEHRIDTSTRTKLVGLLGATPRSLVSTHSPDMSQRIRRAAGHCDAVVFSTLEAASYMDDARALTAVADDLEFTAQRDAARALSGARRMRANLTVAKFASYLRRLAAKGNVAFVSVASDVEFEAMVAVGVPRRKLRVIPNGVDVVRFAATARKPVPGSLLYNGALSFSANADAVRWFASEALPIVAAELPSVELRVTGNATAATMSEFASQPHVTLTGYVRDIRDELARAQMCVVPLRHGAGTRLKILEAFAAGVPVVSTAKGAEGLAVRDGEHALIADTPRDLAAQVIRLSRDSALQAHLASNARALAQSRYDWRAIGDLFRGEVEAAMNIVVRDAHA